MKIISLFNNCTKTTLLIAIIVSFCFGFGLKTFLGNEFENKINKKVVGIGGIFFKSKNPKALREWYKTHLGINTNNFGAVFEWYQGADSTQKGFTQWSTFAEKTKYFAPSNKQFMINYRVVDIEKLVENLRNDGVKILDKIDTVTYGKFVHVLDAENNKIELWEPNDLEYEKMGIQMGFETVK